MIKKIDRIMQEVLAAVNERLAEWATAWVMMLMALIMMMPGDSLNQSGGAISFSRLGMDETTLAVPLSLIGGFRMCALLVNGHWRSFPFLRLIGAVIGCSVYSLLALFYIWPWATGAADAIAIGFGLFAVLAFTDLLAAYRAGQDAGAVRNHR